MAQGYLSYLSYLRKRLFELTHCRTNEGSFIGAGGRHIERSNKRVIRKKTDWEIAWSIFYFPELWCGVWGDSWYWSGL